jgi:hypothetical protein
VSRTLRGPVALARAPLAAAMASPSSVVVHPLVLLSVVDHYNRVAKARRRGARARKGTHALC